MSAYRMNYDDMTIIYEVEGDVDGNHCIVKSILGANIQPIDKETMVDIKFQALCEFADLQTARYLKTGETL